MFILAPEAGKRYLSLPDNNYILAVRSNMFYFISYYLYIAELNEKVFCAYNN